MRAKHTTKKTRHLRDDACWNSRLLPSMSSSPSLSPPPASGSLSSCSSSSANPLSGAYLERLHLKPAICTRLRQDAQNWSSCMQSCQVVTATAASVGLETQRLPSCSDANSVLSMRVNAWFLLPLRVRQSQTICDCYEAGGKEENKRSCSKLLMRRCRAALNACDLFAL